MGKSSKILGDKRLPLFIIFAAVYLSALIFIGIKVGGYGARYLLPFIIVGAAVFLLLGFTVYLFTVKKNRLDIASLIAVLVFGTVFSFVFPANTVPDEPLHFATAYTMSNRITYPGNPEYNDVENDRVYMRKCDADFDLNSQLARENGFVGVELSRRLYRVVGEYSEDITVQKEEAQMVNSGFGFMTRNAVAYVFSGLGITVGRLFGFNAVITYALGRFFNLIFYALCIFFAVKLMPYGKAGLTAIALLPSSLHLAVSYSYDNFSIALVLLTFAFIMNMYAGNKKISVAQMVLTTALSCIVMPIKIVYAVVALFALFIPSYRFKSKKAAVLFKIVFTVLTFASIIIMQGSTISKETADTTSELLGGIKVYTASWVISHPVKAAAIILRTFIQTGPSYVAMLLGNRLGWLQIYAPIPLLIFTGIILFLSFFSDKKGKDTPVLHRIFAFLLFFGGAVLVLLVLMLDWTPIGTPTVLGVQGRYFIPLLPLLLVAIASVPFRRKESTDSLLVSAQFLSVSLTLIFAFSEILAVPLI